MPKIADFYAELGLDKTKFDRGMDAAGKAPSKLGAAFAYAGTAIAASFTIAAAAAFALGKASIAAWDQQEKANAGLLVALKGRKDLQEALIEQANKLQQVTLFEDDAIVQAQKMLAVMGLSVSQIKDLIPLLADLSTATGMDLAQAANLAGKAIGTGTNALGRYGVELDSTMSKTEKANAIMAVFTERYGGQAEKAALAGVSGLQQLKKAWGEIQETIGSKVGPFINALAQLMSGKLFAANGGTAATGIQKTLNDYINADQAGRDKLKSGLESTLKEYNRLWKEAKDADNDVNRSHYAGQADIVRETLEKIDQINTTSNAQIIAEDEAVLAEKRKKAAEQVEIAKDMANKLENVRQELINAPGSTVGDNLFQLDPNNVDMSMFENMDIEPIKIPVDIQKFNEDLQKATEDFTQFKNEIASLVQDFIAESIASLFEALGEAAAGKDMSGMMDSVLAMFAGFLSQLGKMMIAYGVSALAFSILSKTPNPATAAALIIAGGAMVAIGSAITTSMDQASQGNLSGGMGDIGATNATPYTGGDYQNGMQLSTVVSGDDLRFILERADKNNKRLGKG